MADGTKIEWTDATWNIITGCSVVSPGCTNCYAMKLAGTRLRHHPTREGLTIDGKAGPVWNGEVRFNSQMLWQPVEWKRPRMIFVCAHGDLFHENVPDEWIDMVFAIMALAPQHTFQVLTKRPARMLEYLTSIENGENVRVRGEEWRSALVEGTAQQLWSQRSGDRTVDEWLAVHLPLANVWLGVSAEDQPRWDERVALLRATPAAVRWISAEPLLGAIEGDMSDLDWVVVGGESGPGSRAMHPDWARSLRDQCAEAGVAFLFKQWGDWVPGESIDPRHIMTRTETGAHWFDDRWLFEDYSPKASEELHTDDAPDLWRVGKRNATRLLDAVQHDGFPEVLHG